MGATFAVKHQVIGSSEASVGFITRKLDKSGSLGYEFDFSGKVGFMHDNSSDCVPENFECFSFVGTVNLSIDGKTKTLIRTHETDYYALYNCSVSESAVTWDAFCPKNGGMREDDFRCVGQHVLAKNRGSQRLMYLTVLESNVDFDGKIGPPMAGLHQGTQPTISTFVTLDGIVAVDKDRPPSKEQHSYAIKAISTRNKEFPTTMDQLKLRRESVKRKVDENAQRTQGHTAESSVKVAKTPKVVPAAKNVEVIIDDDDAEKSPPHFRTISIF